jgi:hypothetical protein
MTSSVAASPATKPAPNPWLGALYAGLFTAVLVAITGFVFPSNSWIWILTFLLTGAGPVLGYQLATGNFLGDWKSIIGGLLGGIFGLGILLWPLFVGAFTRHQRVGRLYLWHLIGLLLATGAFFLIGMFVGQDPSWTDFGVPIVFGVWGGTVGAAMTSMFAGD